MSTRAMDLPLFASAARCRKTDPDTSREAAARVDASTLAGQVLDALRAEPRGLTTKELARVMDVDRVAVSPRLRPLARAGLVVETDERRGRSIVWRAVSA